MEQVLKRIQQNEIQFIAGIVCLIFVGSLFMTVYMCVASLAYALFVWGLRLRKERTVMHASLMSLGMAIDLVLVLTLEFQRNAVATAMGFTMTPLQQAHIGASTMAVLLYIPILMLGLTRLRNPLSSPRYGVWHMRLGITAFLFRSLGFLLMFSMLSKHGPLNH